MILPDVNVLLYAHRREYPDHLQYAKWLEALAGGEEPFGLSELVASAFVRIVTNPKVFDPVTPAAEAFRFIEALRDQPTCVVLRPGPRSWEIFRQLCERAAATGKLVADAYHAALAIEHGCEWVTNDADFARFKQLRWRHPLSR